MSDCQGLKWKCVLRSYVVIVTSRVNIDISGFTEPYGTDDHVGNEVLQRVKEDRNILQTIKKKGG